MYYSVSCCARWCPYLQWNCCRDSTWVRLRICVQVSTPTQRVRRCRKMGKGSLHQGSHEQYTSGLQKLYSFPVIIMKDILRAEQRIQNIISGDVNMIEKQWRWCIVDLLAMHKGKVMSFILFTLYWFFSHPPCS